MDAAHRLGTQSGTGVSPRAAGDPQHVPGVFHHLIGSSPYTERFLRFVEDHREAFPPAEHCFWIERAPGSAFRPEEAGHLRRIRVGPWGFVRAFHALRAADRVVIHQLGNPRLLLFLYVFRAAARRCAWSIWGADAYYDHWRPRTWWSALRERMRRAVIPAIPVVASFLPGDFEVVRSTYRSRAVHVRAFYPLPGGGPGSGAEPPAGRTHDGVTLMVGNSGDPANDHAWVLRTLARFRPDGIRILVPLSYGDPGYIATVLELGRELFGDRFVALTDFLPAEQYTRRLREVDAVIMNHDYQQALGNIIVLLMMGKKVFVRSDTTPYPHFNGLGIRVFDTLRLPELSLSQILEFPPETGLRNAEAVATEISEERAVDGWTRLFATLREQA